ncbi:MAG: hypothetical protein PHX70_12950 [Clostridium sp.]|nr:hypothetical protein [Clostridium sp.]
MNTSRKEKVYLMGLPKDLKEAQHLIKVKGNWDLSENYEDLEQRIFSLTDLYEINVCENNFKQAKIILNNLLNLYQLHGNSEKNIMFFYEHSCGRANIYHKIGNIYSLENQYENQEKYFLKALYELEKVIDTIKIKDGNIQTSFISMLNLELSKILHELVLIYESNKQYNKALLHARKIDDIIIFREKTLFERVFTSFRNQYYRANKDKRKYLMQINSPTANINLVKNQSIKEKDKTNLSLI